jgi:hypothetical protein
MEALLAMLLEAGKRVGLYDSEKLKSEWAKIEKNGFGEKELFARIVQSQMKKYVEEALPDLPFKGIFASAILNLPAKFLVNQIFSVLDSYLEKNFEYSKLSLEEFLPKIFRYLSERK